MSSLLLPLAVSSAATVFPAEAAPNGRSLVAYFSRSGNTRTIAGLLSRDLQAVLFEIEPASPYPADYFETVDQATRERENGVLPPLKSSVSDLSVYANVFLGFPVWGGTVPPIIRSFLASGDFAGKTIVPFHLHGGFGLGTSRDVIADVVPGATLAEGFVMEGLQERRMTEQVRDWLKTVNLPSE